MGLSSVSGRLGSIDRTEGRDGGFSLNVSDNTPDGSVKLGVKTTMPPGGSVARHAQVESYCECDRQYKLLDFLHVDRIVRWWRACKATKAPKYTPYMTWIKVCCLKLPEKEHFARHAWYGRWLCMNDTDTEFHSIPVTLHGMGRPMRSLYDCVVCLIGPGYTVQEVLLPVAWTTASVTVVLPLLAAQSHFYVDVYWLVNPPPGWGV